MSGQLGADGAPIAAAAREALVEGWHPSMWFGVGIAIALWVFLMVRGPRAAHAVMPATIDVEPALA